MLAKASATCSPGSVLIVPSGRLPVWPERNATWLRRSLTEIIEYSPLGSGPLPGLSRWIATTRIIGERIRA